MTTYRRRKGKDTWHWCKNCSNYPTEDYEEKTVYILADLAMVNSAMNAEERKRKKQIIVSNRRN